MSILHTKEIFGLYLERPKVRVNGYSDIQLKDCPVACLHTIINAIVNIGGSFVYDSQVVTVPSRSAYAPRVDQGKSRHETLRTEDSRHGLRSIAFMTVSREGRSCTLDCSSPRYML